MRLSPLSGLWNLSIWLCVVVAGCSGSSNDSLKSACGSDGECPIGQMCKGGVCEDESPVTGGGEVRVSAAARAEGADAVVDVQVEGGGNCSDSTCTVRLGATVTFTAPLVAGYRFAGWSGDALCVGSEPVLVLRNVDDDTMCIANYVRRLFVRGEGEGVVGAESSADLASCAGASCEVDSGSTVVLTAPARAGFRFAGWEGDGCDAVSGVQVTVVTDKVDVVCTALYVPGFVIRGRAEGAEATIAVSSSATTAVCATSTCQVDAGSPVTLVAPDVTGFRFTGFTGPAACITADHSVTIASADADLDCVAGYVRRFRVVGAAAGASPLPAVQASSPDTYAACTGPSCVVDAAGSATLLAPTALGFRFRAWTGADCEGRTGASVSFQQVDHDIECTAEYVRGVGVNGTAVGASSVVSATSTSPGASCSGGGCVLDAGGNVTLTASAVTGYSFNGWTGDSGCDNPAFSFTLNNVAASKTCVARFTRLRFDIVAARVPEAGGVIATSSNTSTAVCDGNGCEVDYGANVRFVAEPNTGYDFAGWDCDSASGPALNLLNVTAARTCRASFARRTYPLTVSAAPAAGGTISVPCSGASTCMVLVSHGAQPTVTAAPAAGFVFRGWSDCVSSTALSAQLPAVTGARSCLASFGHTVTTQVTPGGVGSVATCTANAPCAVAHGQGLTLPTPTATNPDYVFSGWEGCPAVPTNSGYQLSNITTNLVCTARFERPRYQVSASVSNEPATRWGTVNQCVTTACGVSSGDSITLTATPIAGRVFSRWSNCSTSDTATITLTVRSNLVCIATFAPGTRDLTASLVTSGAPVLEGRHYRYALRATIVNGGNLPVDQPTRVEIHAYNPAGEQQIVDFTVASQPNSPRFPLAPAPIPAGGSVSLAGTVLLLGSPNQTMTYTLHAVADSCAQQTTPPANCIVSEVDETNNVSAPLPVTVPRLPTVIQPPVIGPVLPPVIGPVSPVGP